MLVLLRHGAAFVQEFILGMQRILVLPQLQLQSF